MQPQSRQRDAVEIDELQINWFRFVGLEMGGESTISFCRNLDGMAQHEIDNVRHMRDVFQIDLNSKALGRA
jgi:hypothetical protein